jgi:hypothetical protein
MLDRRTLDVVFALWVAVWLAIGVLVWHEVRGLRPLADTVAVAGQSLGHTAAALRSYSAIPLVGSRLRRVAADAAATAVSARASARDGRRSVDRLAILLGIAVPLVAIGPAGVAYVIVRPRLG